MWDLKNNTDESIYKTETDSQTQKTNLCLPKGKERGERINQEYGINRYTTIYKIDNKKDLLYNIGNCIQYFVITSKGKESEKEYIYLNHCAVHLKLT